MVKKVFRSKLFISMIFLILVAVMVFYLLPLNYEKQNQTVDVIQLIDNVSVGTKITESMVTTRTIGLYGVDNSVITKKEDVIGKYALTDIRRTSNLYADMFTSEWEEVEGAIDMLLTENDRLITISLGSAAKSIGGKIKAGSVIDILTINTGNDSEIQYDEFGNPIESKNSEGLTLLPLMENVIVYDVLNNALESITDLRRQWISLVENGDAAAQNFDASMVPAYVTLVVSAEQALLLANQEYNGEFHFLLKPLISATDLRGANGSDTEQSEQEPYDPFEDVETPTDKPETNDQEVETDEESVPEENA